MFINPTKINKWVFSSKIISY